MAYSRKFYNLAANSILESVIALTIISVCLYIAMIVYASVFSPRTAPLFYGERNQSDELFFLMQVGDDSIANSDGTKLLIEEEWLNTNLKQITIKRKDSIKGALQKRSYYIRSHE